MNSNILPSGFLLQDGKYRIERVLGQGGFGITYLAKQFMLGRKVAIKEFFMKDLCNRDGSTKKNTQLDCDNPIFCWTGTKSFIGNNATCYAFSSFWKAEHYYPVNLKLAIRPVCNK